MNHKVVQFWGSLLLVVALILIFFEKDLGMEGTGFVIFLPLLLLAIVTITYAKRLEKGAENKEFSNMIHAYREIPIEGIEGS